jgi:hypothetical protein
LPEVLLPLFESIPAILRQKPAEGGFVSHRPSKDSPHLFFLCRFGGLVYNRPSTISTIPLGQCAPPFTRCRTGATEERRPPVETLASPAAPRFASLEERVRFLLAYLTLYSAACKAELDEVDPRERLIPLKALPEEWIGTPTLLWMLYQGHVEHFRAGGSSTPGEGTLQPVESVLLLESSCFALTDEGDAFTGRFLCSLLEEQEENREGAWELFVVGKLLPRYDQTLRRFTWGRHLLKCFRQPAGNQETVLCTAEELAWLAWFDDPLPRTAGINPKQRLHDTINALNRNQKPYLVHFKGDGSGARFGWEMR